MTRPEWIEVGRISRAHGVHGELRVLPDSDNPDRFAPGSVLYARAERVGLAGPRLREQVRLTIRTVRGDEGFPIVSFEQVADREAAEALRGCILEVASTELPELEEDEYYPFDLVGLEVRDVAGARWGQVVDVVETPAHALLAVAPGPPRETAADAGDQPTEGRTAPGELLIPFVNEAVPTVSLDKGYVVVAEQFLEQT